MGCRQLVLALLAAAAVLPAIAVAKEFVVGDEAGWKLGVNYTEWADGKKFRVGDALVFSYDPKHHNVMKVSGNDFKDCNTSANTSPPLDSGNDTIILSTAGRKWYICGVGKHCVSGMKVFIDVVGDTEAPAPSPGQGQGSSGAGRLTFLPFPAAAMVVAAIFLVVIF
ncbi:Stellacyanin [Apostasia shenzhenica]|uniref:Stellacyanin n=1 Tax=Apostasia shenzhenica TaxID=1088818 RepID=A0A2I0AJE7_9ASPA|nr:Stellacyanin [Apostasia shenzhenica]